MGTETSGGRLGEGSGGWAAIEEGSAEGGSLRGCLEGCGRLWRVARGGGRVFRTCLESILVVGEDLDARRTASLDVVGAVDGRERALANRLPQLVPAVEDQP